MVVKAPRRLRDRALRLAKVTLGVGSPSRVGIAAGEQFANDLAEGAGVSPAPLRMLHRLNRAELEVLLQQREGRGTLGQFFRAGYSVEL